ncbi:MAG: hypothetical protein JNJ45_10920 [Chthonomonas sp.]|nr:hypothetical protein [Chthonomonas sp.]
MKNKATTLRTLLFALAVVAIGATAKAGGIIRDPNFKPVPEVTDERLVKDQAHQATMGEVKDFKAAAPQPVAPAMASERAQSNIAVASRQTLVEATEASKHAASGPSWVNVGLVLSLLAVLGVSAKAWADKKIPSPQPKRTPKPKSGRAG